MAGFNPLTWTANLAEMGVWPPNVRVVSLHTLRRELSGYNALSVDNSGN